MNPFNQSIEDTFRTRKVKAVSRDNEVYHGYVDRIDWNQRHVILHGAEKNEEHIGAAFISHAERIELADKEMMVEEVDPSIVEKHPCSMRSFDPVENADYLHDVHNHGSVKSFPLLLKTSENNYTVIDGHKRIWAAEKAGLTSQPCRVVTHLSDFRAYVKFAWNHYPLPEHVEERNGSVREERYSDEDTLRSIKKARKLYGDRIEELFPVNYNLNENLHLGPKELAESKAD